jgi:hypothetical protein
VHLYDAHDPYDPPEPFKTRYAASLYDGEIAYADSALGKLFSALKAGGFYDSSVIAIVADHGEAFGEHGEESHGFFLYDETIHVPLLIKLPAERAANPRISSPVGLVDVAPTLLRAVGVELPSTMQGVSLLPLVSGEVGDKKSDSAALGAETGAYAETDYPQRAFGWSWLRALRIGKYLYIDAPHRELYDQSTDPEALHNLAESLPAVSDTLQAQLDNFRQKTSNGAVTRPAAVTAEQAEKLHALGYLVSEDSQLGGAAKERGPDPKQKIEIANLLHHALQAVDNERYEDAVPQLERVLKEEQGIKRAGELFKGVAMAAEGGGTESTIGKGTLRTGGGSGRNRRLDGVGSSVGGRSIARARL